MAVAVLGGVEGVVRVGGVEMHAVVRVSGSGHGGGGVGWLRWFALVCVFCVTLE
jgi:hypothetical protein